MRHDGGRRAARPAHRGAPGPGRGFTLIELLAILAILAILMSTLLPALSRTRPTTAAMRCLNNCHQLTTAWRLYADDNNDLLPPNDYPYTTCFLTYAGDKNKLRNWVVGTMLQAFDAIYSPAATLLAPQTLLSPYLKAASTYKCPADTLLLSGRPKSRSYSMNNAVGTRWSSGYGQLGTDQSKRVGDPVGGGWLSGSYSDPDPNYVTFGKLSSFLAPGPANTWVFIDENPLTINDGQFAVSMDNALLVDHPSGLHANGGALGFVDGHSEIHKWRSSVVYTPGSAGQQGAVWSQSIAGNNDAMRDMAWLCARTTARK